MVSASQNDDVTSTTIDNDGSNTGATAAAATCPTTAPVAMPMPIPIPTATKPKAAVYNPKKPKWWNRLGNNGRDATKSQKKAMRRVLDGHDGNGSSSSNNNKDTEGQHQQEAPRPQLKEGGMRLPAVPYGSTLDWDSVFPAPPESASGTREIWLELGFGRGENLQALLESRFRREAAAAAAKEDARPQTPTRFCLVGAEVSGVGIGCLCKRIDRLRQQQQQQQSLPEPNRSGNAGESDDYVLYRPELDPYSEPSQNETGTNHHATRENDNPPTEEEPITTECRGGSSPTERLGRYYGDRLRIHTGDGYKLLPKIPDGSLSAILITFPDPFPKESDVDYRLVQQQTLVECHRLLRNRDSGGGSHGRLFLATDHDGYHEWCHKTMAEANNNNNNNGDGGADDPQRQRGPLFRPVEPCPYRMGWLPAISRYEQKGWDEGRSTKLSCWEAVAPSQA